MSTKEELLQEAISGGCLEAQYYLACRNQKGKIEDHHVIFPGDRPSIVAELNKLAEKGHVEAQYKLALIYAKSGLSTEETREGVKLLWQLAEVGHLPSRQELLYGKNEEGESICNEVPIRTMFRWDFLIDKSDSYKEHFSPKKKPLYGTDAKTHDLKMPELSYDNLLAMARASGDDIEPPAYQAF